MFEVVLGFGPLEGVWGSDEIEFFQTYHKK
jgi:hypothetical protein